MYAIAFDMDTECLRQNYHNESHTNAWGDVRKFLESKGFEWKQGSVYFGNETVDAVHCVIVVQELTRKYPWFRNCLKDIRMLRIEENNDLMPAVDAT